MTPNFGFSYGGGKIKYFGFLLWSTIGAIIDLILWFTLGNPSYYFLIAFLVFAVFKKNYTARITRGLIICLLKLDNPIIYGYIW